jgi:hypothetical protein
MPLLYTGFNAGTHTGVDPLVVLHQSLNDARFKPLNAKSRSQSVPVDHSQQGIVDHCR